MVLFQGADTVFWFWVSTILTIMTVAIAWFWVLVGRDRAPRRQRRGEETVERYGDLEEDRAPLPKFLIYTNIGVVIWAIAYALWTGIEGIGQ